MRKRLIVLAALAVSGLVCMVLVGSATAAPTLLVLKTARSSGDFAVTSLSASKNNAHALYVRGYGRGLSGLRSWPARRGSRRSDRARSS